MASLGRQQLTEKLGLTLFVAVFATAGVTYLIASHADSCTTASSSTQACVAVDETTPQTTPAATTKALDASCTISDVPAAPTFGQTVQPTATVTNKGTNAFTSVLQTSVTTYDSKNTSTSKNGQVITPVIKSGDSYSFKLDPTSVPYKSASATRMEYGVSGLAPEFNCVGSFLLPVKV